MNERKQHVIEKAHRLFIEKGFQATSIQDILDVSGISKGTFYNYFPSKSELFKSVFTSIRSKNEAEINDLLIGENLADMEIFIKQLDLLMYSNKKNKLFTLIEEVFVSNDPELKQFIKQTQLMNISWMFNRFLDLFGDEKRPYLLDCTILFSGMLHQTFQYNIMAKESNFKVIEIIRYCVERLKKIVDDVTESQVQLLKPELLNTWLPDSPDHHDHFLNELFDSAADLKKIIVKVIQNETERIKYLQFLDFIQEEIKNSRIPRIFLIESSLLSLKMCSQLQQTKEFDRFQQLLSEHVLMDFS